MQDLYGRLWARIESDLLAFTIGRDFDPDAGDGPLLRLVQDNNTIGHFVVCHDTDSLPRIIVRRSSARFDPRRRTFAQTDGVPRKTLAAEAATLAHEHGHFLQWREDQKEYSRICRSYRRLATTGCISWDDAKLIIGQEWDAWMRGAKTLRSLKMKPRDAVVALWHGLIAFQSYLYIVLDVVSTRAADEKNKETK